MYCKQCGEKITEGQNYCMNCGADLGPVDSDQPSFYKTKTSEEFPEKSEGIKWFDTNKENIKDRDNASQKQLQYIQEPSITVFGPFNLLVRKHWDMLVAFIGIQIFEAFLGVDDFFFALVSFVVLIFMWYFAIVHGRRLAWNRNSWENFAEFKRSEEKWAPWGVAAAIIYGLFLIGTFLLGLLYY